MLLFIMNALFTKGRKMFLTESILRLLPVIAGAAFVIEFFAKFSVFIRITLATAFILFIIIGFLLSSERGD